MENKKAKDEVEKYAKEARSYDEKVNEFER
jgi:hypothetical protein